MAPFPMIAIHAAHRSPWQNGKGRRQNPLHSHPHWEFVAYPAGRGTLHLEDRTESFNPGTIFLFPPGLSHGESSIGPGTSLWILFDAPMSLSNRVHRVEDEPHRPILTLMDLLFHESRAGGEKNAGHLLLQTILTLFTARCTQAVPDPRVAQIWSMIRRNLSNAEFRITEGFRKAGLSPSVCHRLFSETTGESPMAALTRLRLEEAKALLMHHTRPVRDVALQVGYPDPFHFSRVFRQKVGLAPVAYRKAVFQTTAPSI